jgi:type VI secretion system secreted protein Hcp
MGLRTGAILDVTAGAVTNGRCIMASQMFLKLDEISGESTDEKHHDEIEVLSWSWGLAQSASTNSGGGGGAGKVSVNDLTLTKLLDIASPLLITMCCTGRHVPKAVLTLRSSGETPLEYLTLTLDEVLVSSISVAATEGDDRPAENVTLNFARFHFAYTRQGSDGTLGEAVKAEWDIGRNTPI